jgi:hypothetical protein
MIILPGDPLFDSTLSTSLPPGWKKVAARGDDWHAFVADYASGILRPVTYIEMIDYVEGGEYDERLQVMGDENELHNLRD